MRHRIAWLLLLQSVLVASVCGLILWGVLPLGVPGEWTWSRISGSPQVGWLPLGLAVIGAYSAFAWKGFRSLSSARNSGHEIIEANPRIRSEMAWLGGLAVASLLVQIGVLTAAPEGFGLIKWATIRMPGASGYLTIAERDVDSIGRFWREYPEWIRGQDALHIGTHPPGLIVGSRWVFEKAESNPSLVGGILSIVPFELDRGLRTILGPLSKPERATIVLIGFATLLACALTVVPVYMLARAHLSPAESWGAACLWPVVPSAILFQPTADCAFPLLSASAVAFASWSCRGRSILAALSGLVLAVGMQFTLAFLPVGLIVAIVLTVGPGPRVRRFMCTGIGFLGLTGSIWLASGANPFLIWLTNSRNHARFYEQFPRSYLAWVFVDLAELAVAVGLPVVIWVGCSVSRRRDLSATWATIAVLLILNFSGKNLSEVARLWLPFMPMLLVGTGAGMKAVGGGARTLAATTSLVGLETLLLQTTIQVVYPV